MPSPRLYLDHAATTPLRPEARDAMLPYLAAGSFGNPSSLHAEGQRARRALDDARDVVALALDARFAEIVFTSGGTEADNAAILGVMLACRERGNHLITTQIEHEAVLKTSRFLQMLGFEVTFLAPDAQGLIHAEQLRDAITPHTTLISVMHANNEVGTIQPVREIVDIAHEHNIYVHTDAVQTFGQCPVCATEPGADLIAVSAHKIGGPKGVGALYIREGVPFEPWQHGGEQERGRRAGTENVAAIAGFAAAVRLLMNERDTCSARLTILRDEFIAQLQSRIPGVLLNGHPSLRLPNNINVSLPGTDAALALVQMDMAGLSASSGSACASGSIEPSHVLVAMGLGEERVRAALRFTLGRKTSSKDIARAVEIVARIAA